MAGLEEGAGGVGRRVAAGRVRSPAHGWRCLPGCKQQQYAATPDEESCTRQTQIANTELRRDATGASGQRTCMCAPDLRSYIWPVCVIRETRHFYNIVYNTYNTYTIHIVTRSTELRRDATGALQYI